MATLLPNAVVGRDALKGYRVFLFSHDHPHPPHVHFGKGQRYSSWDLDTGVCHDGDHFSSSELREQRKLLEEFHDEIVESWNAHWRAQQG